MRLREFNLTLVYATLWFALTSTALLYKGCHDSQKVKALQLRVWKLEGDLEAQQMANDSQPPAVPRR